MVFSSRIAVGGRRKLPVLDTVAGGYKLVFGNVRALLKGVYPWLLMAALGLTVTVVSEARTPGQVMIFIALVFGTVIFSVRWYRHLLNESASGGRSGDREMTMGSFFGRRELRFALLALIVTVLEIAAVALFAGSMFGAAGLPATDQEAAYIPLVLILLGIAGAGAIALSASRLMLAFPIVALGGTLFGALRDSWRTTRGNAGRLLAVMIISLTPFYPLQELLDAAASPPLSWPADAPIAIGYFLGLVVHLFLECAIVAGVVTAAFLELGEDRPGG